MRGPESGQWSASVLPGRRQFIGGRHPQSVFDFWLVPRQIDGPFTIRTWNRIVRPNPAERLLKAITALRIAANKIEKPDIKEA